jgi:proteasome accessory factor B
VPDRLERLTNLLALLLDTPRPLTLEQINDRLQAYPPGDSGRRAFERDKEVLRSEGVPVSTDYEGHGGAGAYRVRPEDYYLGDLDLTADERVALHLALAAVRFESAWGREARWKLGALDVDPAPPLAALPAVSALPELFDGWRQHAEVTFRYHDRPRTVDPWGLLFRDGFWYVVGFDHEHGEQRTFRVDRIEGAVTVGGPRTVEPPEDFDTSAALPGPLLIGSEEPLQAEVVVDAVQASKVVAEQGEDAVVERREDGSVLLRVLVASRPAFRSWLLGLRDHAQVLAPPELRDEVIDWLTAMVDAEAAS